MTDRGDRKLVEALKAKGLTAGEAAAQLVPTFGRVRTIRLIREVYQLDVVQAKYALAEAEGLPTPAQQQEALVDEILGREARRTANRALMPVSISAVGGRRYEVQFVDHAGQTSCFQVEVIDGPPPLAKSCLPTPECERATVEGRVHMKSTCAAIIALDDARAIIAQTHE